ncbi:hypothetical protein AVEN_163524-1 [Araneus ventricosus]|uniref:Uncharacterized protein n=1 Tax=Araneus ventricosus TaxID=182803 RepID=A0A4Y2BSQ8_ARAVE|nr:hypothetical protein AVEN_163524-1 [Araneus ventricosus]
MTKHPSLGQRKPEMHLKSVNMTWQRHCLVPSFCYCHSWYNSRCIRQCRLSCTLTTGYHWLATTCILFQVSFSCSTLDTMCTAELLAAYMGIKYFHHMVEYGIMVHSVYRPQTIDICLLAKGRRVLISTAKTTRPNWSVHNRDSSLKRN